MFNGAGALKSKTRSHALSVLWHLMILTLGCALKEKKSFKHLTTYIPTFLTGT